MRWFAENDISRETFAISIRILNSAFVFPAVAACVKRFG
jgi:hypothetical protein